MTARYQVKDLANTATQTAQTALQGTYAALGQTSSTPTPVLEGDLNSFNHNYGEEGARTYWYHPDHLGSSSYITNIEGIVTQHLEYMPYGESLVEEHQNSINTPYKFNGKEQDPETGNYYYGARYYNPKFSFWLSVDPLAEKMPEWSSYAYAFNNPVMYTDPTGMEPDGVDPPTNSVQINSHIQAIRNQYPDAPIYLMVQTGMDEAQAREAAGSPNSLSYDRYTIQEGTDYANGSFIVSLRHGENKITGSIISTSQVNEVEKSYMLTFENGNMPKTGNKVGGADTLDNKSSNMLNEIVQIINSTGQSLDINASVASKTNEMPSAETMVWGLINGKVQQKSFREFGEQRISTVINSLNGAGANRNLLNSGGVSYSAGGNGRATGTYLDFKFSSAILRNSNRRSSLGTIQLNKSKFQIF